MTHPEPRARRRARASQTLTGTSELDPIERAAIEAQHDPLFELDTPEPRA